MTDKKKYAHGKHPNSLKSLRPATTPERANEIREKGLEVRRENKKKKEELQLAVRAFQDLKGDMLQAVDVLRIAMARAIAADDMDEVTRLAAILAPYETPKLQAAEITQTVTHEDASDEELMRMAEDLGIELKDLH